MTYSIGPRLRLFSSNRPYSCTPMKISTHEIMTAFSRFAEDYLDGIANFRCEMSAFERHIYASVEYIAYAIRLAIKTLTVDHPIDIIMFMDNTDLVVSIYGGETEGKELDEITEAFATAGFTLKSSGLALHFAMPTTCDVVITLRSPREHLIINIIKSIFFG